MKLMLNYSFIFDPAETWQTGSQLDKDLSALLNARGLEAELVETQQKDTKYIIVKKVQVSTTTQRQHSVTEQFANLKKGINGK